MFDELTTQLLDLRSTMLGDKRQLYAAVIDCCSCSCCGCLFACG